MKFKIPGLDEAFNVEIILDSYQNNGNLYVGLFDTDEEDYFADISVNIEKLPKDHIAVDTNNVEGVEEFIVDNNLGTFTGRRLCSGFCSYPVYKMNMAVVNGYVRKT